MNTVPRPTREFDTKEPRRTVSARGDGNKRIGIYVMLVFPEMNGIHVTPSNDGVIKPGLSLAYGETDYAGVLERIRSEINKNHRSEKLCLKNNLNTTINR